MTGPSFIKNFSGNFSKLQNEKDEPINLSKKSKIELMDLLYREERLCKNKKFLEKLPDNGEKILKFYEKVKMELQRRDNQEKLCGELAKLTVNESKKALDCLEWTGDYKTNCNKESIEEDETNPFKILATHSGTEASKQKIIKWESQTEIQPLDIAKEQEDLPNVDLYAKELCHRFDSNTEVSTKKRFYTHRPLNRTSVKESSKNEATKENDSVSPISSNISENSTEVQMLSLQESIAVQHHQNKIQKKIELQSAIDKLCTKINVNIGDSRSHAFHGYREYLKSDSDDEISSVTTYEESEQDDDE